MPNNNRIFYAAHQIAVKPDSTAVAYQVVHGAQSMGMTTNFNLEDVFELGQLESYENTEDLPDVEMTVTKVLDGRPPVYVLCTSDGVDPTLVGRSAAKATVAVGIFADTANASSGVPLQEVVSSGLFTNSLSFTFNVTDKFQEDITIVGNNRVWRGDRNYSGAPTSTAFNGAFGTPDSPIGLGGVNQKEHLRLTPVVVSGLLDSNGMLKDPDCTILPPEVFGVTASGVNNLSSSDRARLQSITVNVDLAREDIDELGRRAPYARTVTFPVDVTCEVTVVSASGDLISAIEEGIYTPVGAPICTSSGNLRNRTIRIATCEGLRLYLGKKNKLQNTNYSGGDTGGGNVNVTYSFKNSSYLTVMHSGDPSLDADMAWATRAAWLGCASGD